MFGHIHDWQIPENYKGHEETLPYRNQGFVITSKFYFEKCAKCGKQRKHFYDYLIYLPENDPRSLFNSQEAIKEKE